MADDIHEVLYTDSKIDALADGATPSDVFRAINGDPSEAVGAVAIHRALGAGDGDGGSQTLTETVETDPDTFGVSPVFDLGGPRLAYIRMTVLTLTADGETFGQDPGDISVGLVVDHVSGGTADSGISHDDVEYFTAANPVPLHTTPVAVVDGVVDFMVQVPRFVKTAAYLYDWTSGEIYAGANNPTAQVRIDVEYL